MRHSPFLRLVIDNSAATSGVSSIPFSTSKLRRWPRHGQGTDPLLPHIEIACGRRPRRFERAVGPPSKATDFKRVLMNREDVTFCDVLQATFCDAAPEARFSHHVRMDGKETESAIKARSIKNILWLEKQSGESRTDFAKRMGLGYSAFKNGIERKSFRAISLVRLAQSFDVSMDFICGLSSEPSPLPSSQPSRPTLWEISRKQA